MNDQITTIQEKKDFEQLWKLVNNTFLINQNFPDQVFTKQFNNFLFEEFDWTMSAEFWDKIIKPLTQASQDEYVLVGILDPDPINYFYREFGYYNWFKFRVKDVTGMDFWKTIEVGPQDSPADALLFNSFTVFWLPMSAKWAIWGDRNFEICTLAFSDKNTLKAAESVIKTWWPADKALEYYAHYHCPERIASKELTDTFLSNYSK